MAGLTFHGRIAVVIFGSPQCTKADTTRPRRITHGLLDRFYLHATHASLLCSSLISSAYTQKTLDLKERDRGRAMHPIWFSW